VSRKLNQRAGHDELSKASHADIRQVALANSEDLPEPKTIRLKI